MTGCLGGELHDMGLVGGEQVVLGLSGRERKSESDGWLPDTGEVAMGCKQILRVRGACSPASPRASYDFVIS